MRLLFELGPIRLDLTVGAVEDPEEDELVFGFVSNNALETEIAVED
jgi:hypothetical protein